MTDQPLVLPEQPTLDAESAATLAVMVELDRQLAEQPCAAVALDPKALARAAMSTLNETYPSIPGWTEPRTTGGRKTPEAEHPEPQLRVEVADGYVRFVIDAVTDAGERCVTSALVPPVDARDWFLAGLAAAQEARKIGPG